MLKLVGFLLNKSPFGQDAHVLPKRAFLVLHGRCVASSRKVLKIGNMDYFLLHLQKPYAILISNWKALPVTCAEDAASLVGSVARV